MDTNLQLAKHYAVLRTIKGHTKEPSKIVEVQVEHAKGSDELTHPSLLAKFRNEYKRKKCVKVLLPSLVFTWMSQ